MEKLTKYNFKDADDYMSFLSGAPDSSMIEQRSLGGGRSAGYVPIAAQEAIADVAFREWNVIESPHSVVVNELLVTVKVQYLPDYPGADYQFCVGVGSKPIQQKSDKNISADNFPTGKITNCLEYVFPAAKSTAVSNALADLGNIFGRNVSRKVSNDFHVAYGNNEGE